MSFLPNLLTLFRLFISPVGAICLLKKEINCSLIILVLAASTDFFDGYFARILKAETTLGKLLDPLADKVLVTSYLVALYLLPYKDKPSLFLLFLLAFKELLVVGGGFFLLRLGIVPTPTFLGKLATNFLFWYLIVFVVHLKWQLPPGVLKTFEVTVELSLLLAIFSYLNRGAELSLKYLKSDGRENRY